MIVFVHMENLTLHVLCGLVLAVVIELRVYVFLSSVNVLICKLESACSHSRTSVEHVFCNAF